MEQFGPKKSRDFLPDPAELVTKMIPALLDEPDQKKRKTTEEEESEAAEEVEEPTQEE